MEVRVQLARRLRLVPLIAFIPIALIYGDDFANWLSPPLRLEVSLGARQLTVIQNGEVVATYGVAIGTPSHPTPTGSFRTGAIDWNPSWTPPPSYWARNLEPRSPGDPRNPMQGVKIYFKAPWYFIHGTNDPGSIGEAASHGCLRMTTSAAVSLAHRIQDAGGGVPIVITQ
jgi:lipoprotein-anchoring transpeptidase ErfK/SrfK